jgi:hypothetical protein
MLQSLRSKIPTPHEEDLGSLVGVEALRALKRSIFSSPSKLVPGKEVLV